MVRKYNIGNATDLVCINQRELEKDELSHLVTFRIALVCFDMDFVVNWLEPFYRLLCRNGNEDKNNIAIFYWNSILKFTRIFSISEYLKRK